MFYCGLCLLQILTEMLVMKWYDLLKRIQCSGAGMIQGTSCGFATAKLGDGQVGFSGHSSVRPYMLRHSLHSCVFEIFRKNFFFFFFKDRPWKQYPNSYWEKGWTEEDYKEPHRRLTGTWNWVICTAVHKEWSKGQFHPQKTLQMAPSFPKQVWIQRLHVSLSSTAHKVAVSYHF